MNQSTTAPKSAFFSTLGLGIVCLFLTACGGDEADSASRTATVQGRTSDGSVDADAAEEYEAKDYPDVSKMTEEEQRNETQVLLDEVLALSGHLIKENGEFPPFALFVSRDGFIENATGKDPLGGEATAEATLKKLRGKLRARVSEGLRATAIASNVVISPGGDGADADAIRVDIEHAGDYTVSVFVPYARAKDGSAKFGPITANAHPSMVFKAK